MVTLKRATIYNVVGALVPTLLALMTIPLYLHFIGPQRFGALSAIWIICGSAGFFDLGLTKAISYSVAKFGAEDPERCPQVVATALLIAFLSSLAGAVLISILSWWYFTDFFKADQLIVDELVKAVPLIAVSSITNVMQGVIAGALQGSRHFLRANLFVTVMTASIQLGPLVCLSPSMRSISAMMTAVLLLRFLGLAFGLIAISRTASARALIAARRTEVRPLLSFSKWTMGISLVAPVTLFADKMLLGAIAGASTLALYSIAFQFAQRISIIPIAVASAVFPDLVNGTREARSQLMERATSYTYALITIPSFLAIILLPDLLKWWLIVDPHFELVAAAAMLILAFWINCIGVLYHVVLLMENRPAAVFYTVLFNTMVFVPAIYISIRSFGMIGAAFGFVILFCIEAFIFFRLCGLKNSGLKVIAVEFAILSVAFFVSVAENRPAYIIIVASFMGVCTLVMLRWSLLVQNIPSLGFSKPGR